MSWARATIVFFIQVDKDRIHMKHVQFFKLFISDIKEGKKKKSKR
jgi:hypothetical protein